MKRRGFLGRVFGATFLVLAGKAVALPAAISPVLKSGDGVPEMVRRVIYPVRHDFLCLGPGKFVPVILMDIEAEFSGNILPSLASNASAWHARIVPGSLPGYIRRSISIGLAPDGLSMKISVVDAHYSHSWSGVKI